MPGQKKSPAIILDIRRKTKLSRCNQQAYQLSERYLWQFQVSDLSPHFLKTGAAIDTFQKSEETREAYGRDQRICVISPAHHSLKPPWNTIWNEEYLTFSN